MMVKTLLSMVAFALALGSAAMQAGAAQVYGHYGQYNPDAPYQGGGETGYRDGEYAHPPRDGYRYRDDRSYNSVACESRTAVATSSGHAIAPDSCRDQYADPFYYSRAYSDGFDSARYGVPYAWRNPYTGHHGSVTPIRDYDGSRYGFFDECRRFKQTMYVDGHRMRSRGTACRNADGSWLILKN